MVANTDNSVYEHGQCERRESQNQILKQPHGRQDVKHEGLLGSVTAGPENVVHAAPAAQSRTRCVAGSIVAEPPLASAPGEPGERTTRLSRE